MAVHHDLTAALMVALRDEPEAVPAGREATRLNVLILLPAMITTLVVLAVLEGAPVRMPKMKRGRRIGKDQSSSQQQASPCNDQHGPCHLQDSTAIAS